MKLNMTIINNSKEQNTSNTIKTTDYLLSVFLFYSGVKLICTEPCPDDGNPNRKFFIFERTEQAENLQQHLITSDPVVKLKKFMRAQKELKNKIYAK